MALLSKMKSSRLSSGADLGILLIRIVSGGMLIANHGWKKLLKLNMDTNFSDPLGIGHFPSHLGAVFTEVVCAALIIVGYRTRLASIPLIFTFAVIIFMVHGGDPVLKNELALFYLTTFTALLFSGSGKYALDHYI